MSPGKKKGLGRGLSALFGDEQPKEKSNFQVSIIINLIYLILTIPAVLMMNVGMFCKYYSLIFFIIYFVTYKVAYAKVK